MLSWMLDFKLLFINYPLYAPDRSRNAEFFEPAFFLQKHSDQRKLVLLNRKKGLKKRRCSKEPD